ncbi:MAG: hypothetical protein KDI17_03980 [Halioglobus sp.]|nr:hypothetical protein [Halioglobus sp.]
MTYRVLALFLTAVLFSGVARAEEAWRLQVTPYLWGPGLEGNIDPGSSLPKIEINRSLNDILNDLEAAFFLTGTARRGRFVALADFTWAKLSENNNIGIPATTFTPPFNLSLGLEVELFESTAALGYTIVDRQDIAVDLLAGVRIWGVDTSVRVKQAIPYLPSKFSDDETWVDPVLVARSRIRLAGDWSAILYADVGGSAAGSDLTWQGIATVNYQMTEAFFLSLGYRYLALDYSHDSVKLDLQLGGPLAGLTYRF